MTAPQLPLVSILIAARNEERTLPNCLRAIDALDYPTDRLEVLIGDDGSTDQTANVVAAFIGDKPAFRLVPITENVASLRGKANVLAQLARLARGQLLFFTDADTGVPTTWLHALRRPFEAGLSVGIVAGVTLPDGPRLFDRLQGIDWLYNLTLTNVVSELGVPVTALGNNMAVSRSAYDAVGGYEGVGFSVTEDYALFRHVVARGVGFRNLLSPDALATTLPATTLLNWLRQRKRWMRGAMQLPVWLVAGLLANYLALPLLLLVGFWWPALAISVYLGRLFGQTLVLAYGLARLRRTEWLPYALLFEPYQLLLGPLAVAYYVWPAPITWKDRTY